MPKPRDQLDILILGPVPPPFGGVAVHISRLVPVLQDAGLRVGVLNHFDSTEMSFVLGALKRNPLSYYRLPQRFPAGLVHYHHSRWSTLMAVALGKSRNGTRYVITIHSGELRRHLNSRIPLLRRSTRWALRRFDAIIAVNGTIASAVQQHVSEPPIEVLPAFLETGDDETPYEVGTEAFFSSGRTLVVPVYRIRFLKDGRDVYGLDLAVDAFLTLARDRPELRLAIFIAQRPAGRKARKHLSSLVNRVDDAGLTDRLLIEFGSPLVPTFRHDVIVVRPTRTDGDALSVREALHTGVRVIASDVVKRPSGTLTFAADDPAALSSAIREVLDEPRLKRTQREANAVDVPGGTFRERLISIYRRELSRLNRA